MADLVRRVCEAYSYHGQLGRVPVDLGFGAAVRDAANRDVWDSNKVFSVTARSVGEIHELSEQVDALFAGLPYRHYVIDPLTSPEFAAHLAFNDFEAQATTVQMVLDGTARVDAPAAEFVLKPVATDSDWAVMRDLVRSDHAEGARSQGSALSEAVTDGIVASYRAKGAACQFFIGEHEGVACSYGSAVACPNGMGMVEDLFTLPEFRGRGFASAVIAHCVAHARERGAAQILIGSHAHERPKHLYRKLGFEPVCLTTSYFKRM